jgi:hypothetical protein
MKAIEPIGSPDFRYTDLPFRVANASFILLTQRHLAFHFGKPLTGSQHVSCRK